MNYLHIFKYVFFFFIPAINAVIGEFKTFVAQQMADVEKSVKSCVSRARRSLQFDMNKKFEEIRLMMAINCPQPSQEKQVTADLSSRMPLKTIDEFLIFDEELLDVTKQLIIVSHYLFIFLFHL